MIEEILPAPVASAEAFVDPPEVTLFPEEEAAIAQAAPKRRQEFATARACARAALAKLGRPPVPILPGLRGAPQWPDGVVGSITHCAGYRACAVAPAEQVLTLGLDAENNEALPEGVLDLFAGDAERADLARLTVGAPHIHWDRVLFSIKETVYKAWFPVTHRCIRFEDSHVDLSPDGTFAARLLVPPATCDGRELAGFVGRWLVRDGLVATAIVLTRAG